LLHRPAIRVFATPSAAVNNARARWTCRYGATCERDNLSNVAFCAEDITNGAAGALMHLLYRSTTYLFARHTTR
jgi:hypothetical protein